MPTPDTTSGKSMKDIHDKLVADHIQADQDLKTVEAELAHHERVATSAEAELGRLLVESAVGGLNEPLTKLIGAHVALVTDALPRRDHAQRLHAHTRDEAVRHYEQHGIYVRRGAVAEANALTPPNVTIIPPLEQHH